MLNSHAFAAHKGYTGDALAQARASALTMGYNFRVVGVDAAYVQADDVQCTGLTDPCVRVTVKLANDGVAPFYYDLGAVLYVGGSCTSDGETAVSPDPGATGVPSLKLCALGLDNAVEFGFHMSGAGVCMGTVKLGLVSSAAYNSRPVKLAHAYSGDGVPLNIPSGCS
jgi:hypothetical protein